jgi:N-acetylmuramic acid 6-phosphate (MurNAc-6-P) etherase
MSEVLDLLGLVPSAESTDYVTSKTQFHLHTLLTEQRHPATWDLGFAVMADTASGLRSILAVDDDLEARLRALAAEPAVLEQMAAAIGGALRDGRRVYVYGCGATGRLAKQIESSFWRPFWERALAGPHGAALRAALPADIGERVVGEMTGGDRALVSSLEGFEDLPLLGALQLRDHGIAAGDVVICVTEGGETSSVIGTALEARAQHEDADASRRLVYFVYNNPDEVLRPFDRSRRVLDEPGITKLRLATGPQAISGSTRMQATSIETFVVGLAFEHALRRLLEPLLGAAGLEELGFRPGRSLAADLGDFAGMRAVVRSAVPDLARLTDLEAETYAAGRFATYLAGQAMVTVFTDCTERSPTFRLFPLDRVDTPERRCWVRIWTAAGGVADAWRRFLGRPFCGLDADFYGPPLRESVTDPYLRKAALDSLANAGADQEALYDFSFAAANVQRQGPRAGDLGVLVLVDEECAQLADRAAAAARFRSLCHERGARLAVVCAGTPERIAVAAGHADAAVFVALPFAEGGDPLGVRRHVAVKMALNAHSSAVMAKLGRVVGNTMTNVSPSNLKLIGRATFLIQSHVDDVLRHQAWIAAHGGRRPLSFADANAVLFDAMAWVRARGPGQTAEVALSIVRILEAFRTGGPVTFEAALGILEDLGLAEYLRRHNPALDPASR